LIMSVAKLDGQAADNLILKIAEGDMSALEQLYNAMYGEIFAYLFSMLGGDRQNAEDLAQDTFVRVFRYAPKFAACGQGRAWVYRIAGRLALNHFGRNGVAAEALDEHIPDAGNVEESAVNSAAIAEALAAISPEERQVVSLHAFSGLTLREISEVLGQPLGTVKWRHAEAIKKLRMLLDDHH
jgi:RNA polymerase sigma factor, sigma-70 family